MVVDRLTIVQVLPEMDEGGVEGETLDFAIYCAKLGHRSIVISGGGRLVEQLERNGAEHVRWKHIGTKSVRCLQYIHKLRAFLQREGVDILHLRSRLPAWIGYFAWNLLDASTRASLVTSFHGFYSVNSYSTIMTKGQRVIAVSKVIKDHILDNYRVDPGVIELIHGGYDEAAFDPDAVDSARVERLRKKWQLTEVDAPIIMLPGRITSWKGQDVFIDALAQVSELPFVAVCVGDIEEHQSFTKKIQEKIRDYGLTGKIRLVGHCSDMPAALSLADLVVSASSLQPEAFGKVAIEAMAMAKPIIATSHGGSLETVVDQETGWLVEPGNVQSLAKSIRDRLENSEELRRVGDQGRRWVQKHFTARNMCEKTLSLYQRLVEQKRRQRNGELLTVVQMLPELDSGGVERGTLEIGKYLVDNGHRSFVISGSGRMVEQLKREGSTHICWKVGAKSPLTLRYVFKLRKFLQREQVHVLHLRSRMPAWIGYFAWKSLPAKKRPVLVTTFHGFYSVNSYSAIMTKGTGIIAISKSIEQHIKEAYGVNEGIKLIFRGVDKTQFDPSAVSPERIQKYRASWQLQGDKPVIMLPGRLTRLKGQDIFIKALAHLTDTEYQAVLVGAREENPGFVDELSELIRSHGLEGRIRMVGHCEDMPAALMLADVVVSASSREPEAFGRTTIEAMAMGKPVIATAHGGSLETVTPGLSGWLVKPGSPEDLAKALSTALGSPETMARYGEAGKRMVDKQFTMKRMCDETITLYRRLFITCRPADGPTAT